MNSSRRKKKEKKKTVFGQGRPRRTGPVCFCGDKSHHWWHSVVSGKQLGCVSQRSVRPAWTTAHFYNRQVWNACVCVWACAYGWYCILCEDWLWSGGYGGAELETICCLLLRAAGQQSAMLIDHLFKVQNETDTFKAAHTAHQPAKCNSLLYQQTVYITGTSQRR